ncbi:MAG TPA: 30S ribosomal protein S12 methylthiotransferase RimO [Polyangiaceae bacterium]|nr:30S ribosomal protein S12 methylthiotransferase RimO [Polyangiaceae bacterium]
MSNPRTIHFVSLGCPKNRVDSEIMLGSAHGEGFQHVDDAADAEVIVVNTCGFIDAAKKESIDTILEMAEYKKTGACQKLVVTGCLSQRYSGDLSEGLPEVDHFLGSSDMPKIRQVLRNQADRMLVGNPADWVMSQSDERTLSTRGASAYVKIAEGCNRSCSFCVIPQLRGKQRSRSMDDVVREVERLVDAGVLEVNLVSQDTIAYGRDRDDGANLPELVQRIADVPGLRWLRIFYLYPEKMTDRMIELISDHPVIVPYVDMPLQHAADGMLRRMRRGHGGKRLYELVERMKKRIDGLTFRTAFIVGHPGETDQEFEELLDFVRFAEFDRVGVFHYSDEPEARAYEIDGKVDPKVARARAKKLMTLQRKISKKKNAALVGQRLQVLVEGASEESDLVMVGRHRGQAPEIDGTVFLSGGECQPGSLVEVVVGQATDYDLLGEVDEGVAAIFGRGRSSAAPVVVPHSLVQRASDGRRVLRTV